MCDPGSAMATGKRVRWGDTGVRENLRRSWTLTWNPRKAGILAITWRQQGSPVLAARIRQGTPGSRLLWYLYSCCHARER